MKKANPEYHLCRQIANYLRLQYPKILYHFDYSGMMHTKAQAGKMKMLQNRRGFPDLFIMEPRGNYYGLFIEVKIEGTKFLKKDNSIINSHIKEQSDYLFELSLNGYKAIFGMGFDEIRFEIDKYLTLSKPYLNPI
jgi:hypothetical protein